LRGLDGVGDQPQPGAVDAFGEAELVEVGRHRDDAVEAAQRPIVEPVEQIELGAALDPAVHGGHQLEAEQPPDDDAEDVGFVLVGVPDLRSKAPGERGQARGDAQIEGAAVGQLEQRAAPLPGAGADFGKSGIAIGAQIDRGGAVGRAAQIGGRFQRRLVCAAAGPDGGADVQHGSAACRRTGGMVADYGLPTQVFGSRDRTRH